MRRSASPRISGRLSPPGDKSIGHRLAILGAIARGTSRLEGFPPGEDCQRSLALIQALGAEVRAEGTTVHVEGVGRRGLASPEADLDAGNSGTTARLACGLLAGQPFDSRIVGDESLSRRPFERVTRPLIRMGAAFETRDGKLPVTILGGQALHGIDYALPVPSAQVKTAVLLAGLYAEGDTIVREAGNGSAPTRDHTERALRCFGASVEAAEGAVRIVPPGELDGARVEVPGDISSAAFFIGAAAALPGSELVVERVGVNPTRTGFLTALRAMGASIDVDRRGTTMGGEPWADLVVTGRELEGTRIAPEQLPALIDEVPVLAVVAALAKGETIVRGASELRVKESDRLAAIVDGLSAMGADIDPLEDGFTVRGGRPLRAAALASHGDHRLVMAWAIASLVTDGPCTMDHLDQVKISYPAFWDALERLSV